MRIEFTIAFYLTAKYIYISSPSSLNFSEALIFLRTFYLNTQFLVSNLVFCYKNDKYESKIQAKPTVKDLIIKFPSKVLYPSFYLKKFLVIRNF